MLKFFKYIFNTLLLLSEAFMDRRFGLSFGTRVGNSDYTYQLLSIFLYYQNQFIVNSTNSVNKYF